MSAKQSNEQHYLDLFEIKPTHHVYQAIETASFLADQQPLNAAHLLNSVLFTTRTNYPEALSKSFSKWATFFPEQSEPKILKHREISEKEIKSPSVNSFVADSFEVARPFLLKDGEFWGRDYITVGLLALGDPSLREIELAASRDIGTLRNLWFEYVTTDTTFSSHRPWADWWRACGLPVPGSAQPAPIIPEPPSPPPTSEPPPSATRLPDVWMLSDRPLEDRFAEQDRFQFEDYANALAAVLDHEKTETPFTMAINAPWGAGKTTLANMIAQQLQQRPRDRGQWPHIICWFNAWMHDDATNLATALIAEVGRTADKHRSLFHRIFHPLPMALLEPRSRNWRRVIALSLILAPTLWACFWLASHLQGLDKAKKDEDDSRITLTVTKDASGKEISRTESSKKPDSVTPAPKGRVDSILDTLQSRIVVLAAFFTAVAGLLGLLTKTFASTPLGGFVESPDKAAEIGAMASAEKQLRKLISQATWRGNRFVIFVDDIERCKPPRSIDVLDAISQLLSQKGMVVVLLGDMSAAAASAQLKYKDIAKIFIPSAGIALTGPDRGKEAFGRLYLQKIIQFQFDLPIPPTDKIRQYMKQLTVVPQTEEGNYGGH